MIKLFQQRAYNKALRNLDDKRVKEINKFNDIKIIGILFEIKEEEDYRLVLQLIDEIRNQQKKVYAIAYCNEKHLPVYCEDTLFLSHFCKKDIKGLAFPKGNYVERFTNREYDLLINLDRKVIEVLFYLFSKTKAKCKTAIHHEGFEKTADFMINISEEDYSYKTHINELVYYLNEFSQK